MIGLSLSFCIKDVLDGTMPLEAIDQLITGTKAETDDQWEDLIDQYSAVYWVTDPVRARRIVLTLRELGKIDQPRTRGERPPTSNGGHWIDGPTEIDAKRIGAWALDPPTPFCRMATIDRLVEHEGMSEREAMTAVFDGVIPPDPQEAMSCGCCAHCGCSC